jgi:hypothetical protein
VGLTKAESQEVSIVIRGEIKFWQIEFITSKYRYAGKTQESTQYQNWGVVQQAKRPIY